MDNLSIHQMTALEIDPLDFVSIVAESGCQEVSVFTRQPSTRSEFPLVTQNNCADMAARLRDTGVNLANIESFMIMADTDVEAFKPALELGAELGARGAVTQIFDAQESRLVDKLGALCDIASTLELNIAIEFMALAPVWNSLPEVAGLVARVAHPNLAIGIDILHLVRSGGSPADVAALDRGLIGYAQLCDGESLAVTADYAAEAVGNRLTPGDGVFPLAALLEALPAGTPLELEVPQPPEQPALERVRRAVNATRQLLGATAQHAQ